MEKCIELGHNLSTNTVSTFVLVVKPLGILAFSAQGSAEIQDAAAPKVTARQFSSATIGLEGIVRADAVMKVVLNLDKHELQIFSNKF